MDTQNRRAILERIANHVQNQDNDNLAHNDTGHHNDHSGGYFPEFETTPLNPSPAKGADDAK